jgi:putative ABC transport system permease protein
MRWPGEWLRRLKAVRRKPELDEELNEEVRFHLEMETEENIRRGMNAEEARYEALRRFGGVEQRKEEWRDERFLPRLEGWLQDLGYAWRALKRARTYALFAVLSLALGIGANTAIFTLLQSLVLRPLAYPEPGELVRLWESMTWMGQGTSGSVSVPNLRDWREQSRVFEAMGAYTMGGVNLTLGAETMRIAATHVESEVFAVTGVAPMLGRAILKEENTPGRNRVAVLSHGLWERSFGADPGVVGRSVGIDGAEFAVVGVMPKGFQLPPRAQSELWVPIVYPRWAETERGSHWLPVIARLKHGVDWTTAQQEMNGIAKRLEKLYPENATRGVRIEPLHLETVKGPLRVLVVLWLAVMAVLLLACANVAHLVLARAAGRRRELALRVALGASRWRVVRLFLMEGLLLAAAGGLAGYAVSGWSLDGMLAMAAEQIPEGIPVEADGSVMLFCAAAALLSAMAAAVIPALKATRIDLQGALKEAGSATGYSVVRGRSALMVWEVALSLVLVMGALSLFRSLRVLNRFDLGLDHEQVLTMKLAFPETQKTDGRAVTEFFRRTVERVQRIPGVSRAAVVNMLPVRDYSANASLSILGRAAAAQGHEPAAEIRVITPGYFEAMGIPLAAGRYFTDAEMERGDRVAVINRKAAELYWPGQNPIGQAIAIGTKPPPNSWLRIVGVAGNIRHAGPHRPVMTAVYLPISMWAGEHAWPTMNLVIRASVAPESLAKPVRDAVREIHPDVAVYMVKTMGEVVSNAVSMTRLLAKLLAIFGGLAVVLALVGVYGVMAYLVSQRAHEIGVRIALGAGRGGVMRLVLHRGLKTGLIGVVLGTAAMLPLLMTARHFLIGFDFSYVWTYAGAALVALVVAAAASSIPAWRASRLDPLAALREE